MKLSFNLLRPIIFFFCGLGYLPLQSADVDMDRDVAAVETTEHIEDVSEKDQKNDLEINPIN